MAGWATQQTGRTYLVGTDGVVVVDAITIVRFCVDEESIVA
eukprot:CAMPEP_0194414046 /NCGR_PEP_ID=MMETSP0176-20130528/12610_1 /TAXON_ID=216777 /ORGANISM="Proboscia alata, Strain PI-D3" /LENGTH=40 /DNA_ID= /DNA_START= /DNA_END= /DNA_ORIENTATION=